MAPTRRLLVLVTLCTLACRPSSQGDLAAADQSAITDSVLAAMRSYEAAVKALDAEGALRHFAADSQFRLIDNETTLSYGQVAQQLRQMFPSLRSFDGGFSNIRVHVLRSDVALADASYIDIITDSSGAVTRLRGTVTWVWMHGPDGWRIVHGHAVAVPDSAQAH